ncbi:hypothetical protein [Paraburkholderia caballeronis]|uniref:Uncharacterized protein n=1 Tax=Paraburkholderia caballeronis TaxID=416943 RepID=A0A1H7PV49_9BURK|nr:hypothetical protein [Paraburkholderia caballeronis]PXW24345.1 hypothetical protein C7403_107162 [Paraburkholderia caballeronis]PXX00127.1 hypothetical protein C7407_107162 [Paraburkholderia caballeronis]RAJ97256.1 hypothetical protein C7409_107162 [Paraburkholderia caballeronis]SEB67097.1 hypothetical protein SAMN05445871_0840 [Paraburkholderia caballeronis]SEL39274.1 hypothetical protein SAMN05192542_107162 [Paraburkholderia caballeronis]
MYAPLPDYLIREQATVGALVTFGVLRVIGAAVARAYGWRIVTVERLFVAAAALYCMPSLADAIAQGWAANALAQFEGNVLGSAVALFFAPILSHRLGYE